MGKRTQTDAMRAHLKRFRFCELCGSESGIEVHHKIPVVCGGSDDDINLISVCSRCHSKLTPKSELTKLGIERVRVIDAIHRMRQRFYELAGDVMFNDGELTGVDWPDVFDITMDEFEDREHRLGHA